MDLNILRNRLAEKGIPARNIHAYLRDVTNNINSREEIELSDLNYRLKRLGWDEFELDDHTLQLIIANIEKYSPKARDISRYFLHECGAHEA